MSHDCIADALNMMMNAARAKKDVVEAKTHSKLLLSILALAKIKGYVKEFKLESNKNLKITNGALHACGAIKPRFVAEVEEIERYVKRYLPSKNIGILILSTSQGLMTHQAALEKNIGGSLLAYFY